MTEKNQQPGYIHWFRQAMPYINAHRGKTFVIALSGAATAHSNINAIVQDIALLNTLGAKIVLVHGVREQLEQRLAERNIASEFVGSRRVTDAACLHAAIEACSLVRAQLETRLSMGLPNSPMHGAAIKIASANVVTAQPAGIIDGTDLQFTGKVRKIDTSSVTTLLEMGNVVLLSPLGYSPTGEAFSLVYHEVAAAIARAIAADKLIVFSERAGIVDSDGELLRELDPDSAHTQLANAGNSDAVFKALAQSAIDSATAGVRRVHLMDYQRDGALLEELFTVDGSGTMITSSQFETMRAANASDVAAIIDIIEPLEQQGVLLRRDRDQLRQEIHHFTVVERDGLIVALAALYPYADEQCGEIACIVTHPDYRKQSRGATLLAELEKMARGIGLKQLFVLTTQTAHWFLEQGFSQGDTAQLPAQKQQLYNYQRNSRVLVKAL